MADVYEKTAEGLLKKTSTESREGLFTEDQLLALKASLEAELQKVNDMIAVVQA